MKKFILFLLSLSFSSLATDVRLYTFGHSLIDHRPPAIPTPSDETTILHWINDIALFAGHTFATGGQYGFLTTHDNLPPASNWGYNNIPAVWDDTIQPFSAANINTILITAANFIQYQGVNDPHPLDATTTVIQSTSTIFDWVNTQQSGIKFYIYENWPEMDLTNAYPPTLPTATEVNDFHQQTLGTFHTWWSDYLTQMHLSRPTLDIQMISVGPIISKTITQIIPGQLPFSETYEDSAPHGRASLYFLAGMITYMAIYNEQIPQAYMPSTLVHSSIRNNLPQIRNLIWNELNPSALVFENGFE